MKNTKWRPKFVPTVPSQLLTLFMYIFAAYCSFLGYPSYMSVFKGVGSKENVCNWWYDGF